MKFDSYPVYLSEDEYVEFWKDYYREHNWKDGEDLAWYVHYPWCRSVCKFCVFGALKYNANDPRVMIYENAVLKMMEKMAPVIGQRIPSELFFGGGTPSLWTMESLKRMTEILPNYDKIPIRRTELHPFDITPERLEFLVNDMKFHHVSFGIQSFDKGANIGQNRIPVDTKKFAEDVRQFQKNGLWVNMDLVCLFNGDAEENWGIFENDLRIAAEVVQPDGLTVSPNYKSADFYGNSVRFREIIKKFSEEYPQYHINNGDIAYSTDYVDIMKYMDQSYIFLTEPYAQFVKDFPVLKENKSVDDLTYRNIIAFGGIADETAFSRTAEFDYMDGKYEFGDDEFRFYTTKREMFSRLRITDEEQLYDNKFYVGRYELLPPLRRDTKNNKGGNE